MVRKRRAGPAASSPAALLLLLLSVLLNIANGYRKVGCLFSKNICKPDVEDCYYDNAFGRCLVFDENLKEDDLYQYDLAPEELDVVRVELERLEYQGYKWSHDYTQCVMQIILDDLRYGTHNNVEELCKHLRLSAEPTYKLNNRLLENELNDGNLREDDGEEGAVEEAEEGPLAMIKFTPSRTNPHGEFADEFYYPPDVRQRMTEERRKAKISLDNYEGGLYDKLSSYEPAPNAVYRRGSRSLSKKSLDHGLPQEYMNVMRRFLADETTNDDQLDFIPTADDKKTLIVGDDDDDDGDETDDEEDAEDYEKTFARKYKQARQMQAADFLGRVENDYDAGDSEEEEENEENDNKGYGEQNQLQEAIDSQLTQANDPYYDRTVPPLLRGILQSDYDDLTLRDGLLWGRDATGFKRRERLDVKKPGPLFSTNNYAFKTQSPSASDYDSSDENEKENEVRFSPVKKEVHDSQSNNAASPSHENVDLNYVYIQFKQNINSWSEGNKIVKTVAELIGLKPRELNVTEVGRAEVTFKVSKNSQDLNATQIVNKIADARDDLQKKLNVDVIRAGIANSKTKLPAMLEVSRAPEMELRLFGVLVGMGVVAACAGAFVLLMIARRHAKSRAKLAGLRTPDPEASSDYQELCRARMQAKQSDKLTDSPKGFDFGRLLESGRSESNRSSTSSWSEEPPNSSIDVATGHVVLSYMEDHLKNQEKLDEEWAALCAYEAEPCSTAIAENNADRNRPGASLPYDHSRVILNDLANLKSSDYINASTITDHDPRNPAYIATQGPLPQTTADFWQLVWEQGSVVIVMLTKLTEEGHAMCHRYWPDEGSEIYHIYEIHIVSEHIWCDDYLVRSFYLKNLRTGETRTVTQFHFQSWPNEGVPKSTKALLEFRRKVNKSYRGRSCPIIVHCSDGAGRTGTYCLIDMLLNRMSKGAKEIDLAATLEHIRDQRPGMVANKKQFEFVLMAVAEEVHAILKTLPSVADKPAADKQPTKSDK